MKPFRTLLHLVYVPLSAIYAVLFLFRLKMESRPRKLPTKVPKEALKVGYLLTDLWAGKMGGAAIHKAGFCKGLKSLGHTPVVIVSDAVPGLNTAVEDYNVAPQPEIPSFCPKTFKVLSNNLVFANFAADLLRKRGANVLCQRNIQMNFSGALLSRKLGVPFVLEYNSPANWKGAAAGRRGFFIGFLSDVIEKLNLLAADQIMVVSDVLKNRLVEEGVEADRVAVNPNGADAEMFSPTVDPTPVRERLALAGKVVVAFAGNNNTNSVASWHGVKYLAAAVSKVARQNPKVHFLFIGDQGLVDLVKATAPSPEEQAAISFAQGIPHPEMPRHYAACDILVSPHVHMADGSVFFGSPVKIFEYMAMGKAIVASNVGQLSELLRDGENALLTNPGDVDGIASAILKLADDPELRQRLGKAARATCVGQCTWKHNAERFVNASRKAA